MTRTQHWPPILLAGGLCAVLMAGAAPQSPSPEEPADRWLTNAVAHPLASASAAVQSNDFPALHAEVVADALIVKWEPDVSINPTQCWLHVSAADPAHWPTRDWRRVPMSKSGRQWQGTVQVEDVDVAQVYCVRALQADATNLSPLRVVNPRAAGLLEPNRPFWPFLDGFEIGWESWQILSLPAASNSFKIDPLSKTGRAALSVSLPPGKRSVSLGTTRIRGWQLQREGATGVRVWLRTRHGNGRARCTLLANAFAAHQAVAVWPDDIALSDKWRKVDLHFRDLGQVPLGAADLFAIEFIGDNAQEFLLDDLQLLGPWKLDPE